MGIRKIRKDDDKDDILRKVSKKVEKIDDRILTLLDDMVETMNEASGVGLAAPQVGILRRVIVVDIGDGRLIELINPVIVYESGTQIEEEGCLSVYRRRGEVERPSKVIVKGLNRKGEPVEYVGEELLARALCHEVDHLNGILFTDKAKNIYSYEPEES